MISRKIVMKKQFNGTPTLEDFEILEEPLNVIQDGEILTQAEWHSVDPYMRMVSVGLKDGEIMPGRQIARVLQSKTTAVPEGSLVMGNFGWRDLTVYKPEADVNYDNFYVLQEMKGLPESFALGAVGRIGNTAFFGLTELCSPKEGDTLVVSAAAGAVGSVVGQIGKIKGCKVIGFAGSDEKLNWMKNDLGFDHVFNYKTINIDEALKLAAPQGVDCYFDNVGGEFTYHVMNNMNLYGRIALCGAISSYNSDKSKPYTIPVNYHNWIYKQIKIEAFVVTRWKSRWLEGITQLRDWVLEGKLQIKETVVVGFENMPSAFISLFKGDNIGKIIVKSSP
ncbi:unnamed protein product [Allacma fusca]|uniref:15-oxoprostaglandin 13-reductase n=1 Tax=Allacma fusca TaxID=39272 RepID=A0A8J2PD75_9HEXA|nr:unnamed protein product [Allacma fusca]